MGPEWYAAEVRSGHGRGSKRGTLGATVDSARLLAMKIAPIQLAAFVGFCTLLVGCGEDGDARVINATCCAATEAHCAQFAAAAVCTAQTIGTSPQCSTNACFLSDCSDQPICPTSD